MVFYGILALCFMVYNLIKLCTNAVHAFQYMLVLPEDKFYLIAEICGVVLYLWTRAIFFVINLFM